MNDSNIIIAALNSTGHTTTESITKVDYGLILKIEGENIPSFYEVDFSNEANDGESITRIGTSENGVQIPPELIETGNDIYAFLVLAGENYGRTTFRIRIPNDIRPDRENETPTPEQQSAIDQAIAALNNATEIQSNYELLVHKPQIESVELAGNKTLEDLGIQPISNMRLEELLTI